MCKKVILLTACINPNGMAFTALQDCEERKRQYKDALSFYLRKTRAKIVFVDNSGYDIGELIGEYNNYISEKRLEMFSFFGNDYDKNLGKGYGEALIIEYALNQSLLLKNADIIIKITGRLICSNINLIMRFCMIKQKVTANLVYDQWNNLECLSHIFAAPYNFYTEYFLVDKNKLNDSKNYWFEHLLLYSVKKWKSDGMKYGEFPLPPIIKGQRGSVGVNYKTSLRELLRYPLQLWRHRKLINAL